jgi:uncharacterized protein
MLAPPTLAALALVVLAAFTVETALGFGATVVTVALGSFLAPIEAILPSFVPINIALSLYIAARYRRDVDRRLLFGRIVPLMGLGLPFGMLLFRSLGSERLKLAFGVFVVILSLMELFRMRRGAEEHHAAKPGPILSMVLLFVAGIIHGIFATGGPLAVYVTSQHLPQKARFRATLSALWLVLNIALVGSFILAGTVSARSLGITAALVPALLGGMVIGEVVHRRVPEKLFRTLVLALLLAAGVLLAVRAS